MAKILLERYVFQQYGNSETSCGFHVLNCMICQVFFSSADIDAALISVPNTNQHPSSVCFSISQHEIVLSSYNYVVNIVVLCVYAKISSDMTVIAVTPTTSGTSRLFL